MSRFINPVPQYLNSAGDPIVAGQMFFYEVGSTTPKDVYLDAALTIPAANPVLLNADGRMPDTYLLGSYRTILSEPSSGEQWERDNVGSEFSDGFGAEWNSTITYNIPDVVLFDGNYYQSLTNNNVGNSPAIGGSNWEVFTLPTKVTTTVLTSSVAAWEPNPLTKSIEFVAIGGGGGGGGADGDGGNTAGAGGGGGGGGYALKTKIQLDSSYAITIGAGGTGRSGTVSGDDGGTTTVTSAGVSISCFGGLGGQGILAAGTSTAIADGGACAEPTGGDLNIRGGFGGNGHRVETAVTCAAFGGSSFLGPGGQQTRDSSSDGIGGRNYGGGGGGATTENTTVSNRGGDGAQGVVVIKEYV